MGKALNNFKDANVKSQQISPVQRLQNANRSLRHTVFRILPFQDRSNGFPTLNLTKTNFTRLLDLKLSHSFRHTKSKQTYTLGRDYMGLSELLTSL